MTGSIFERLYKDEVFVDRVLAHPQNAVDVIIPVIHTNELWRKNLLSIYREIPVNRLIIGDGGCIDDTIKIVSSFPRVEIIDQRDIKTLGFAILDLIKHVETQFFLYLHSDVYIAENWYDKFYMNTEKYDWFECEQRIVSLVEYDKKMNADGEKNWGYGGSQMGRTAAFADIMDDIDDDYLYRNEDIIIRTALQNHGYKWGFDASLFHYHEVMRKESPTGRIIKGVVIQEEIPEEEQIRTSYMQFRGLVKYLRPTTSLLKESAKINAEILMAHGHSSKEELIKWVQSVNPEWCCIFSDDQTPRSHLKKILNFFRK